jgi:hypothetical protein
MPIIREFRCRDCDTHFESMETEPACPVCTAAESERVFLTPPGIKSPKTADKDKIVKSLAADYGLSNMSNREGQAVRQPRPQQGGMQARFGDSSVMQSLSKLPPGAGDGISSVLPMIKGRGPRTLPRVRDRR